MNKLTKQQAIAEHRKIWRWIAEQTEKQKRVVDKIEYLRQFKPPKIKYRYYPSNLCFCCEYGEDTLIELGYELNTKNMCKLCPIDWGSSYQKLMCVNKTDGSKNIYELWANLSDEDWQQATKLAKQIAELPEREGEGE